MSITLQKIAGAILFSLILIWSINFIGDLATPTQHEAKTGAGEAKGPEAPAAVAATGAPNPAAPPQAEQPLGVRLASADPTKGAAAAKKCGSCHTFEEGGPSRVGPNLHGVVGRDVAAVGGFAYSQAMQGLPGNWTYELLDQFLAKPNGAVPGTKMSFAGVADGQERAAIIAYLRQQSPGAPPPPQ